MKQCIEIVIFFFFVCNINALSSDDFIVQSSNYPNRYRTKIYLGQIWDNVQIDDNLIEVKNYEIWSGYKDVLLFYYENIEITTARLRPNDQYHTVVDITIIGKGFCTISEITVGNLMGDVISTYGEPKYNHPHDGLIYSVYRINDPHVDRSDARLYNMSLIHKDNVIQKIQIHYVYNI